MADRNLKRPMFRRGGSTNEGIMTGLHDQSVSADGTSGGLNSLVRPGYEEGGDVESGGFWNSIVGRTLKAPVDFLGKPVANVINPAVNALVGTEFEQMRTPYDAMDAWTWNKLGKGQHDIYNPDGDPNTDDFKDRTDWGYSNLGKGGHEDPDAIEWEDEDQESNLNQPKIVGNETGVAKTSRADDITAIYEDLLPMLQGTLGADKGELGRQKYLELAKFGANLMAQPGGNLAGAIGKAAADPLAGMTRIAEQQRQSKRVPAELAMKIALRETEGGPLMKNARDLMKADSSLTLKEAMAKVMPSDSEGTTKLIVDMAQKGGLGLDNAGAVITYKKQIKKILSSDSAELAGEFSTPLPEKKKDLGEEEIGNYYVKKNGELVRWDGIKLLKIDDTGFTGEVKKRKKKKKST
jgi:hypothetical protein